jgi:hypothetical protein
MLAHKKFPTVAAHAVRLRRATSAGPLSLSLRRVSPYTVMCRQRLPASQFYPGMDEKNCPTRESLSPDIFR